MKSITKRLFRQGITPQKGINKKQLLLLNLKEEDDINSVLGRRISTQNIDLLILLRDIDDIKIQNQLIANYKSLQAYNKKERNSKKEHIIIYCDGGCNPNPGKAGSGVAIYRDAKLFALYYGLYVLDGTNNTAELGALYQSLLLAQEYLSHGHKVEIKCDSKYSIDCISKWAITWEKNDWKKKGGIIKNIEIIQKSYALFNTIKEDISLSHIKAHAGFEGNELADRMTVYAMIKQEEAFVLYDEEIHIDVILAMKKG
jgi:ribonuclease HI